MIATDPPSSMQIQIDEMLNYVGRSPVAEDFSQWLDAHRIYDRPHIQEPEDLEGEDRREVGRVEEVERHSLALIYAPKPIYRKLVGKPEGLIGDDPGDFVLREIALFGPGVQQYRGFEGDLPFGLRFGVSAEECIHLLGKPIARRRIHELPSDLWVRAGWVVNASYLDDGGLGILHVRRVNKYDERMLASLAGEQWNGAHRISADPLIDVLGRSGMDMEVVEALRHVEWDPDLFDLSQEGEITDYVDRFGVTLYFGGDEIAPSIVSGIRLNRQGDMDSLGYEGLMPFGIEFHSTPLQLEGLVGRRPDRLVDAEDTGAMLWNLGKFDLHVMYSLIDFQVYRVTLSLPRESN